MKISAEYLIDAPRPAVFDALGDPEVLARCIEGCESMKLVSADTYEVKLRLGVAGLKGNYTGSVQLKDRKPPEDYVLLMHGKGGPGFVRGEAKLHLAERGTQTAISCDADVQAGGMIAAIGSRLIEAIAKKMMDDFFRKLNDALRKT